MLEVQRAMATVSASTTKRAPTSSRAPAGFRPEIEGLRGVAVLLVVADHAFAAPTGGFTGVDVFFVISGYLITRNLLARRAASGRVSIARFYLGRVRRLLPAAATVLVATVVVARFVWYPERAWSVALDGLLAAVSVQNWHLVAAGTDYLHQGDPASPLQHFWSLAVEEQFYAVWPVVLAMCASLAARRRRPRVVLLAVTAALVAVSIAIATVETAFQPTSAYFDTLARAWELGAGALVAAAGPLAARCPTAARTVLFVVGTALITAGALISPRSAAFPWPLALLPVAGTVLVLVGADGAAAAAVRMLDNRPLRWVGRRSYSLYLWHFPALVVAAATIGRGPAATGVAIAAAVLLATASERWLERPFTTGSGTRRAAAYRSTARPSTSRRVRLRDAAIATTVATALAILTVTQFRGPDVLRNPGAFADLLTGGADGSAADTSGSGPDTVAFAPSALRSVVAGAAVAPDWPGDPEQLLSAATPEALPPALRPGGCRNDLGTDGIEDPRSCSWGPEDAAHTAVVVGDSIALGWTPAIVDALGTGWRVEAIGYAGCPVIAFRAPVDAQHPRFNRQCAQARERMHDFVAERRPDLVVTSSADPYLDDLVPAPGSTRQETWGRSVAAALSELSVNAGSTLLLEGTPTVLAPNACASRFSGPEICRTTPPTVFAAKRRVESAAAHTSAGRGLRVRYQGTADWLCAPAGCPAAVDDTLVRVDDKHLTDAYVSRLGDAMRRALQPALTGAAVAGPSGGP